MDKSKEEALRELLELISDYPDVADRITITIRPGKVSQGTDEIDAASGILRTGLRLWRFHSLRGPRRLSVWA